MLLVTTTQFLFALKRKETKNLFAKLKGNYRKYNKQVLQNLVKTESWNTFDNTLDPELLWDYILKLIQKHLDFMCMEGLDVKSAPQAVGGRGVLRTPMKDFPPTVGRGRGAGLVHNLSSQLLRASKSPSLGLDPTAVEMVNGPLTSVLQQLSIAIDPTPQASMKGLLLRPEYYVQHIDKGTSVKSLDHSKMSFKELMSGMSRVMLPLDKSGGDLGGYLEHFSFIARKGGVHGFVDSAYVSYNCLVMDQYINGESDTIDHGDPFYLFIYKKMKKPDLVSFTIYRCVRK